MIHDFMKHSDYAYTHEWLIDNLYLSDLMKHLYDYIHHCSQCKLMQTSKHYSYKFMQFILTSLWSFHVFTINFILVLSVLLNESNIILSVINKFSKTVIFISKQKNLTTEDWTISLLNCLILLNWNLLWIILSDCDWKFIVVLWKSFFC